MRLALAAICFSRDGAVPVDELRQEYPIGRPEALAEVTAQLAGLSPSDPFYEPYLTLAEELDIPVAIHTGLHHLESPTALCRRAVRRLEVCCCWRTP